MGHDGLDCDIESILQCRENEEFDVLQRLSAFCQDFRSRVAVSIETYLVRKKEYADKYEAIAESIAQLHAANKDKVTERDNIVLQQKVTDKKMLIATKQQAKFREEINEAKSRKESIALQMVDLAQEYEDSKRERKEHWNALKMACSYYKENLDFHIELNVSDDHDLAKVTFFRRANPNREKYYVNLLNYKNNWKIGHIEPILKEKHLERIKAVIDMENALDTLETVKFLWTLRNILLKHYFVEKKPD